MRTILVLAFCALVAAAQTSTAPKAPPFASVPWIEDRNLYYSFFVAEQAIFTANQATKATNPSDSSQIDQQTAATLDITVQELPLVAGILRQANQSYAQ